jgi:hypothetical protein
MAREGIFPRRLQDTPIVARGRRAYCTGRRSRSFSRREKRAMAWETVYLMGDWAMVGAVLTGLLVTLAWCVRQRTLGCARSSRPAARARGLPCGQVRRPPPARFRTMPIKERSLTDEELRSLAEAGGPVQLAGENLDGARLREVKLRGANLEGASLRGADLSRADLTDADLTWARLEGADLRGARLISATLSHASLDEADLTGASLGRADLRWARFREAKLNGADLIGASLEGAEMWKTELSGARVTRDALRPLERHLSASQLAEVIAYAEDPGED